MGTADPALEPPFLFMAIPKAALSPTEMERRRKGNQRRGNQGLIPVTRVVFLKTELKQTRVKRPHLGRR